MAWSSEAISADELAWAAADKPMISSNALYADVSMIWVVGKTNGTTADSDDSEEGYQASFMADGLPGLPSKPDSADTLFTIVINALASPVSFDWVGIVSHNLDSLASSVFRIQIADDGAFATNLQTVQENDIGTALSSDRRYANLVVDAGASQLRILNAPYVRIGITCSSGVPYIGELILGRRYQQDYQPDAPFDDLNPFGNAGDHTSDSGVITRSSRSRGGRALNATFHHDSTALQAEVLEFWDAIEGGEQPFLYHDAPDDSPMDFNMMLLDEPTLVYPFIASGVRDLTLESTEIGPEYLSQDP